MPTLCAGEQGCLALFPVPRPVRTGRGKFEIQKFKKIQKNSKTSSKNSKKKHFSIFSFDLSLITPALPTHCRPSLIVPGGMWTLAKTSAKRASPWRPSPARRLSWRKLPAAVRRVLPVPRPENSGGSY